MPVRPTCRRLAGVALITAAVVSVAACGDTLRDADYAGEAQAVFVMVVDHRTGGAAVVPETLRAAVFWSVGDTFIQHGDASPKARDDAESRLVMLSRPPAAARAQGFALGKLAVYDDLDDDGRMGPDEVMRGAAETVTIVWSPDGLTPDDAPITAAVPPGYVRLDGPLPCLSPFEVSTTDAECDSVIGQDCRHDLDCSRSGLCVTTEGAVMALGVCGLQAEPDQPCVPPGSRRVPYRSPVHGVLWTWMPGCTQDDDCGEKLRCAAASGTCQPLVSRLRVIMANDAIEPTVCLDEQARFMSGPPGGGPPDGASGPPP